MALDLDLEALKAEIMAFSDKVEKEIDRYVTSKAKELEAYMKKNRPWTDRTPRARPGLSGEASKNGYEWTITLSHGVEYGRYLESTNNPDWSTSGELSAIDLEFKWEKKWAIVNPTLREKSPEVIKAFNGFLEKSKLK